MTNKIKRWLIICSIFFSILIIVFVKLDYKMPHLDKHSKWATLSSVTSDGITIKKSRSIFGAYIEIAGTDKFIVAKEFDQYTSWLINNRGDSLHEFNNAIYIDRRHNRIIEEHIDFSTTKQVHSYIAYDINTLANQPISLIEMIPPESYHDFLISNKIKLNYENTADSIYKKIDSIYPPKYRIKYAGYLKYLQTLQPITSIYDGYERDYFYTDEAGHIYDIGKPGVNYTTEESINKLNPIFLPNNNNNTIKNLPNFSKADSAIVIGNNLEVNLGLIWGRNTAAFEQDYLSYFTLKLTSLQLNFKVYNKFEIGLDDFKQLNIPKTDNDTLAFVYRQNLYQVYRKQ